MLWKIIKVLGVLLGLKSPQIFVFGIDLSDENEDEDEEEPFLVESDEIKAGEGGEDVGSQKTGAKSESNDNEYMKAVEEDEDSDEYKDNENTCFFGGKINFKFISEI